LIISRAQALGKDLSPAQERALIEDNAVDLPDDPGDSPDAGADWDGSGMVDFKGSIDAVANVGPPPVVVPTAGLFGTLAMIAAFGALLFVLTAKVQPGTQRQAPTPGR
jgi:hypothetical protein